MFPMSSQDVNYTVVNSQNKKEKINLLTDVSGFFNPGQMSALVRLRFHWPRLPAQRAWLLL